MEEGGGLVGEGPGAVESNEAEGPRKSEGDGEIGAGDGEQSVESQEDIFSTNI